MLGLWTKPVGRGLGDRRSHAREKVHGVTSNIFWGHIPAMLSSSFCFMNILYSTSVAFRLVSETNFQLRSLQTPLGNLLSVFHSALTCISMKHMKVILLPPLLQSDALQNFMCTNSLPHAWPSVNCNCSNSKNIWFSCSLSEFPTTSLRSFGNIRHWALSK
jgi:hypothetical protein